MSESNTEIIVSNEPTPAQMLSQAIDKGLDVDQLEKLMALKERWDKEQARQAFAVAMSQFQGLCPPIKKDKKVEFNKTSYYHATLGSIAETIREPLEKCKLTYRWEMDEPSKDVLVMRFILTHAQGHEEVTTLSAPMDDSGHKNLIQQKGSTVSYLQRYTLITGLGLTTALEDDDGAENSATNVERLLEHNALVRDLLDSIVTIKTALAIEDYEVAIEAWDELSDYEKRTLWLATSKGGIFYPGERKMMHSDEWSERRRNMKQESSDG